MVDRTPNTDLSRRSLPAKAEHRVPRTVLTIAGSDSGGGAGIQADLRAFSDIGLWGTSAITCVTAQNPDEVRDVQPVDPEMVSLQIRTVCDAFDVAAAKTGMLYSTAIIEAVARSVAECEIPLLVVDPVMIATSGARLLKEEAVKALCEDLIPRATVITPNVPEAEILCGNSIDSLGALKDAARKIGTSFQTACVVKGGHLEPLIIDHPPSLGSCGGTSQPFVVDVLWCDGRLVEFSVERVHIDNTHGTGCMFSAALAASLAMNNSLEEAVRLAQNYVARVLRDSVTS